MPTWTCPFCPLLCDAFEVEPAAPRGAAGAPGAPGSLTLRGSHCHLAQAALARFGSEPDAARPQVGGQPSDLNTALAAAAGLLAVSRQPLFGGLGTDVAGARALYALANDTGAFCDAGDAAASEALMQALRALQDRGGTTLTLAELRSRADLVLCLTGDPTPRWPEFLARAGLAHGDSRLNLLDPGDDLLATLSRLAALVDGRTREGAAPALVALAERLQSAGYVALVYEPARLPAPAALAIEMLQRVVATLNRSARAAALALGGAHGSTTVNQVFTWLSGLPLRSHRGPHGLEHDGTRFAASRLLAQGAVDLLLWVASFGTEPTPPAPNAATEMTSTTATAAPSVRRAAMPRIVIGHPRWASEPADVFIPVATPGIGASGHLMRTDGSVLMPLHAVRREALPGVAEVLGRLRTLHQEALRA